MIENETLSWKIYLNLLELDQILGKVEKSKLTTFTYNALPVFVIN